MTTNNSTLQMGVTYLVNSYIASSSSQNSLRWLSPGQFFTPITIGDNLKIISVFRLSDGAEIDFPASAFDVSMNPHYLTYFQEHSDTDFISQFSVSGYTIRCYPNDFKSISAKIYHDHNGKSDIIFQQIYTSCNTAMQSFLDMMSDRRLEDIPMPVERWTKSQDEMIRALLRHYDRHEIVHMALAGNEDDEGIMKKLMPTFKTKDQLIRLLYSTPAYRLRLKI